MHSIVCQLLFWEKSLALFGNCAALEKKRSFEFTRVSGNLTRSGCRIPPQYKGIFFAAVSYTHLDVYKRQCQYHVVFAPKYRRMVIYGQIRADIGKILRKLCEQKGVEIIQAEACPDHIHMLISIPPKYSVSQILGYLKRKSSLMIFDRHANLKYQYGDRHFWARGY